MPEESKILSREEETQALYLLQRWGDDRGLAVIKSHCDSLRRERDEHFAARVKLSEVLAESVKNTEQAITERDEARSDADKHFNARGRLCTDIERLTSELAAAIEAQTELQVRKDALYADCMIAHHWFSEMFGDAMNGRDFVVKVPMARERMAELKATIEAGKADKARIEASEKETLDEIVNRDYREDKFGELVALFGDVELEFSNLRGFDEIISDCESSLNVRDGALRDARDVLQGIAEFIPSNPQSYAATLEQVTMMADAGELVATKVITEQERITAELYPHESIDAAMRAAQVEPSGNPGELAEGETEWARGAFDDGSLARIMDQPISACPSADVIGEFSRKSWLAGWADADADIAANGIPGISVGSQATPQEKQS